MSVGRSGLDKHISTDLMAGTSVLHNFKISILLPESVWDDKAKYHPGATSTAFVPHHSGGCKSPCIHVEVKTWRNGQSVNGKLGFEPWRPKVYTLSHKTHACRRPQASLEGP